MGLIINLMEGSLVTLRTSTREVAGRLSKVIYALAKARGSKPNIHYPRFGAAVGPLSEAQARAAGIPVNGGVIVSWTLKESPAEKAQFSLQDILTATGGKAVQKTDDQFSAIEAAAAAGAKEIRIAGLRLGYRPEGGNYIESFVPITFTLAID
jgi:S1-C subfamily serine protease